MRTVSKLKALDSLDRAIVIEPDGFRVGASLLALRKVARYELRQGYFG
jgi:hypothetical protein